MAIPTWLPLLLGLLSAVGPLSTDMYLPAFPAIDLAMGGRAGAAQITLAAWFAGLAIGQITMGPLSDRYGRRRPLLVGTALFSLATIGIALTNGLFTLSALRFVSALGASASMVVTRAVVRDLSDGHGAARLMSKLMLVMGAAPILAPSLGGLVLAVGDWHAIFWICAGYGALCCGLVFFCLPETLPESRRITLSFGGQVHRYAGILGERAFITHALLGGFSMFAMFAYLGGSPGVFIDGFHLSPSVYGMLFGLCAFGFIACSQVNPRILPRFGANRVLRVAIRVFFTATLVLVAAAFTRTSHWWAISAPIFVIMSTQGFTMPNAVVGALSRHAGHAGSASALMGTMQFGLAAVSGAAVGLLSDGTARPMAGLMLLGALGAVTCDLLRPKTVGAARSI